MIKETDHHEDTTDTKKTQQSLLCIGVHRCSSVAKLSLSSSCRSCLRGESRISGTNRDAFGTHLGRGLDGVFRVTHSARAGRSGSYRFRTADRKSKVFATPFSRVRTSTGRRMSTINADNLTVAE